MIYLDTETCGLHGVAVLIQWAEDDGPIHLFSPWTRPVKETLALIEYFCNHEGGVCTFNMAFDWFHLQKLHNLFSLCDPEWYPDLHIEEIAALERRAIWGPCIKPVTALDLMLHAMRGPYQSVMERKDIVVRRVPTVLAESLAFELNKAIQLREIYFARKVKKVKVRTHSDFGQSEWSKETVHADGQWKIRKSKRNGEYQVGFSDVYLSFAASRALKNIAADALPKSTIDSDIGEILKFKDVEVAKNMRPSEVGYAPFADCAPKGRKGGKKKGTYHRPWPMVVEHHIQHWTYNEKARKYASLDVQYLRLLRAHFSTLCPKDQLGPNGLLMPGDDDSVLACSVASTRWRGYAIHRKRTEKLIASLDESIAKAPKDAAAVKRVMKEVMTPIEFMGFKETNKVVLAEIEKWTTEDATGATIPHPAAVIAKNIGKARTAQILRNMLAKVLKAGRLHASFKVIGALSGRMSGTDGFNPHAVNKVNTVRECFTFADNEHDLMLEPLDQADQLDQLDQLDQPNWVDGINVLPTPSQIVYHPDDGNLHEPFEEMSGGDYASFEVSIAEAEYKDPVLREELMSGKKMHALFGMSVRPEMTYAEIVATDGTEDDVYSNSKTCVFAIFYGAMAKKISEVLGISEEQAQEVFNRFFNKYQQVGVARALIFDQFCSMRQPEQFGPIYWKDPSDYIASALGFKRYFTLENGITKALFDLANKPPKEWANIKMKITRRRNKDGSAGKEQLVGGATCSALYGAAFGLQALNMRAACNHVIQAFGASITKRTQRTIWDLQPSGVKPWRVRPANFHDEINVAHAWTERAYVKQAALDATESFRPIVPLIRIDWKVRMRDWSGKHG